MSDGAAPHANERPEFFWDLSRRRLIWANAEGLAFWREDSLTDLAERFFAPDDATVGAMARLAERGDDMIRLSPDGAAELWRAQGRVEKDVIHVILNELERSDALNADPMSDGFEYAPRPLAIFDAVGGLSTQNEADRLAFGAASLADRYGEPSAAAAALGAALTEGAFSHTARLGSGEGRWRANYRRLRATNGKVEILAEFSDISDRPESEGVSRRALAAIAHDFRAPLTAISGFAEFLASGRAPPDRQAEYLEAIRSAAEGLSSLADRMVALGRGGEAPLSRIDLNGLTAAAALLSEGTAELQGVLIETELAPEAAEAIGDRVATTRILQNLISNALRHSDCKTIRLTTALDGDLKTVTIADDGVGMADDHLSLALTPYGEDGSGGLGLSNCVTLAESMGAAVSFDTAPGAGFPARLAFPL